MKLKKWLIAVLSCVTIGAIGVGFSACKKDEAGSSAPISTPVDGVFEENASTDEIPENGDSSGEDAEHVHIWNAGEITTPAGCGTKGVKTYTCDCQATYTEEIPATGVHTWDNGTETKAPTCTKEGETTYTCTVCKTATKTEPIDKLPHEHNTEKWTSNATYHWHECECGDKKDEEKHTAGAPATATTPQTCTVCGYVLQVETGILFNTLTVDGTKVYGKVSNTTTEFSFIDEVTVKGNATYVVDNDKDCGSPIRSKTVDLVIGDNTFYVLEMIGNDVKLFTVTIRRRPMYEVTFNSNGGTSVEKQVVEEDCLAVEPTTTRTGYTFTGWDYDFAKTITQTTKITASWSANKNTKYTVNYYLQNLGDNYYTLHETIELEGETDATATAEIKEYEHFIYNESASVVSGSINGDGSLILEVYYTRDVYTIATLINNTKAGTATSVNSTYKFDKEITLTATTNIGYIWLGWYDGETCVCGDEEYTIQVEKDVTYTAKFEVEAEMSNFDFTSTTTTCSIMSIKDKTVTKIIVPDYVTLISKDAFSGCGSLTEITIPFVGTKAGVTASDAYQYPFGYIFGENSYTGSTAITQWYYGSSTSSRTSTTYYVPTSLKKVTVTGGNILYGAFFNCDSLTNVEILDNTTSIGDFAFFQCRNLTNVKIPDGATSIGDDAFQYCSRLTKIVLPDSVTSIGGGAFSDCSSLTSVVIGNGVTSIGGGAFRGCRSLTKIVIPDSVTDIDGYAFSECSNLMEINIPNGITSIVYFEFQSCISLTEIVIPESVTSIGNYAFEGCKSLTRITFEGTVAEWNVISKGTDWNNNVPATEVVCSDGTVAL